LGDWRQEGHQTCETPATALLGTQCKLEYLWKKRKVEVVLMVVVVVMMMIATAAAAALTVL